MRLLSTKDLQLRCVSHNAINPYTILSHTWGNEEVTHQEMLNPTDEVRSRAGFRKILRCAEISREMGYDYTWIDTCCIDKTSSAELSEAINSMFTWYRDSGICLAHLEDFHGDHISQATAENRWFTRGWTLQELIAPEKVYFYSASWSEIGRKPNNILDLLRITQIDAAVLDMGELDNISVAEKMRWLARRNTTKPEDMAYCMLGIFNVNIPLIYGEGEKAFKRLQEEIMRSSDDVSILLWKAQESNSFTYRGALARNAIKFAQSTAPSTPLYLLDEPFSLTNKGLRITAKLSKLNDVLASPNSLIPDPKHIENDVYRDSLFCLSFCQKKLQTILPISTANTIILRKLTSKQNHYTRAYPGSLFTLFPNGALKQARKDVQEETFLIMDRLPLSDYNTALACKRFAVTVRKGLTFLNGNSPTQKLRVFEPDEIASPSHSVKEAHFLEAVYGASCFPSLSSANQPKYLVLRQMVASDWAEEMFTSSSTEGKLMKV
ncbi:unnamed protein product [Colletotrichum noveboracense]|uniref:Heterokaryon incompatibility domain-containing protein n=1 Tax=Colletotrichum noveboracense TaxID=2664923 RepID=A0A9W4RIX4_9PEZI|nr:unnamed protein product [Colletotrichum noveboracense]